VPKQIYQLKDFSGGINTLQDPADIQDNQFESSRGFMFNTQGSISPSYVMNVAANKVTAFANTNITTVESGFGLGYFETDRNRDAVTVAVTSSITGDDDNEGSATGFIARLNGGIRRELERKSGGTQQNLAASFPVGTRILITSSDFSADGFDPKGQGIYDVVEHNGNNIVLDRAIPIIIETPPQDFWGATITGVTGTDFLLLIANPATHKIDVYSTNTAGTNWESNAITLRSSASGVASQVLYYSINEAIRCCDTAIGSSSKIQWYGFIQRRHFDEANSSTDANAYLDFYAKDNTLSPPSENGLTSASTASPANFTTYPAVAGTGFEVNIITDQDENGAIPAATYELASTFIYDGNQESLPFAYSNTHTVADAYDLKSLSLNVTALGPYDPRISGGRIYIREQGIDAEYTMLIDIDLTKGCRTKFSDDFTEWHDAGSSQYNCPTATASANFVVKEFGLVTYEVINGFSSSIFSNAIGDDGENWKDSVVANNRAFVCNLNIKDDMTGKSKALASVGNFGDRIMYSMPNRFDTFPYHNYIEAAKGDNDEYVAIDSFADRLLAFKRFSLDIINIASPDDAGWFLEDSKRYMGIRNTQLVKKTQYGLVFANPNGLFLYNGNNIVNLSENLISDSDWSSHMTTDSCIIYDEQESQVYVIKQMDGDGQAYMCDLKKNVFTRIKDFTPDGNDGITNSVDTDQNVYVGYDAGSQIDVHQLVRTSTKQTGGRLYFKDLDFGDPSAIKKIYAVYVTYKSDEALTGLFHIRRDGSNIDLDGTIPISSGWNTVKIAPSSPITCTKAQFRLDLDTADPNVYINDVSIEYRIIKKKAS
tara:strand:- start:769 stop:3243 length:2475 start_codon:yes stop_codon:yes gene_type:complete